MKVKQEKVFTPVVITLESDDEYSALALILTAFIGSPNIRNHPENDELLEIANELRDILSLQHN